MRYFRIILPLALIVSTASAEVVNEAVASQGSATQFTWKQYRNTLELTLVNSAASSDEVFWTIEYVNGTVTGGFDWTIEENFRPSNSSEVVPATTEAVVNVGTFAVSVRRNGVIGDDNATWSATWVVSLSSTSGGVLGSFPVTMSGTQVIGASDLGPTDAAPGWSAVIGTASPFESISYHFAGLNATDENHTITMFVQLDATMVPYMAFDVPPAELPTEFSGTVLVPSQQAVIEFIPGVLVEGVATWNVTVDSGIWQALVLFPAAEPELLRMRLSVDVFSEDNLELVVKDGWGNTIDTIPVIPGVYSTALDLEFSGFEGHEVTFELSDGSYAVTVPTGGLAPMKGGDEINLVPIQIHKADDPPAITGLTSVSGQNSSSVQTISNGLGTMVVPRLENRPWNPLPGFAPGYTVINGAGGDYIASIDAATTAALGQIPESGGYSGPEPGPLDSILGANEALASGLPTIDRPGARSFGTEEDWTIAIGTIRGIAVPDIVVPLTHPAISVIRALLLVMSSLLWVQTFLKLFKF